MEFIYSGSSIFGKHEVIKEILQMHQYRPEEAGYIGDETRDIEAAKKAGVSAIAVSWGFNSRSILEQYCPDVVLDAPQDLLKIFSQK
jgi:phosphoglycolate phosphatase